MMFVGEIAAISTAFCWTATVLSFETAGRYIGSLSVNLIRLLIAVVLLSLYGYITRGVWFPTDASMHAWIWLSASAIVGFTIGDFFLFQALVMIGARLSTMMMALVPPITAIIGLLFLGEVLSVMQWLGMVVTVLAVYHFF